MGAKNPPPFRSLKDRYPVFSENNPVLIPFAVQPGLNPVTLHSLVWSTKAQGPRPQLPRAAEPLTPDTSASCGLASSPDPEVPDCRTTCHRPSPASPDAAQVEGGGRRRRAGLRRGPLHLAPPPHPGQRVQAGCQGRRPRSSTPPPARLGACLCPNPARI